MIARASLLVFLVVIANAGRSYSQSIIKKEQPILAGVPDGTAAWEKNQEPLGSWGNWTGSPAAAPNAAVFSISHDFLDPAQGVIVAGAFDTIGDSSFGGITAYAGDLGPWARYGTGIENGIVYSTVCTLSNHPLIFAGGTFTSAGGTPVHHIAMWDGTSWHALGRGAVEGVDSTVLAMAVMGDSLYVGGNFTHAGGKLVNHIAIWNFDSDEWEPIVENGVIGVDGGVAALLVPREQPILYAGGGFLHAGGISAQKIASFSNGHWSGLGDGIADSSGVIECLCEGYPYGPFGGLIIAGGHFQIRGGTRATDLAIWNTYDSTWSTSDYFLGAIGTVYSLSSGVNLFVGGDFYINIIDSGHYLVELQGNDLLPIIPNLDGPVYALCGQGAIFPEGYSEGVFVGGDFSIPSPYFASWSDGEGVNKIATQQGSQLLVYPNPVTDRSTVRIQLLHTTFVSLAVYNSAGEKLTTLCQRTLNIGTHEFELQKSGLPFGTVVFVVLRTDIGAGTEKLIVE